VLEIGIGEPVGSNTGASKKKKNENLNLSTSVMHTKKILHYF
jgi:hypothetical protein